MPLVDLGAPPRPPAPGLEALPRRLTLTLPELRHVAGAAGGAPLPFAGRTRPVGEAAYDAVLATLPDPAVSLARRGLSVGDAVDPGLLGAVGLLASPRVAIDVDVTAGGAMTIQQAKSLRTMMSQTMARAIEDAKREGERAERRAQRLKEQKEKKAEPAPAEPK